MGAIDLVQTLMAEGVEFATDGERIKWRNSGGRMTPETVAELAAAKPRVIEFLTGKPYREADVPRADGPSDDATAYLDFLRSEGPTTYGAAASRLGWRATRTWKAEAQLRAAGLVRHDDLGKTVVLASNSPINHVGIK